MMMMMKMKQSLCRVSLVVILVELSWLEMGHSMHRAEESGVSEGGNHSILKRSLCLMHVSAATSKLQSI